MTTPCTTNYKALYWAWTYAEHLLNPSVCPFPTIVQHFKCKHCKCDAVRAGGELPRFCSTECRTAHRKRLAKKLNDRRAVPAVKRECTLCGSDFSTNRPAKYCSTRCRINAWRKLKKAA